MKFGKKLAALALGTALTLSLAACGEGSGGAAPVCDVPTAVEKLNAAKSMEATMVMEMDMTVMDQQMATKTTMEMAYFKDPMKMKTDMTMDMGELGAVDMSVYAAMEGSTCTAYLYDGSSWVAQAVELKELQQFDAMESMNLYLESAVDYTPAGTEEINGAAASRFTGVLRGEALEQVMNASGALTNMETGMEGLDLAELYSGLEDLEVTVWVDQASGYPVRYTMDMTGMMQGMMEKAMTAAGGNSEETEGLITVGKMVITMDCFHFDSAADFEIPAEALAA